MIRTMRRKRRFKYLRWSVFAYICLLCIFLGLSMFIKNATREAVGIPSYCLLSIIVVSTSATMAVAFCKFYRIVSQNNMKSDFFNKCYIAIQITGLIVFLASWCLAGIFLITYAIDFHDLSPYLSMMLLEHF